MIMIHWHAIYPLQSGGCPTVRSRREVLMEQILRRPPLSSTVMTVSYHLHPTMDTQNFQVTHLPHLIPTI